MVCETVDEEEAEIVIVRLDEDDAMSERVKLDPVFVKLEETNMDFEETGEEEDEKDRKMVLFPEHSAVERPVVFPNFPKGQGMQVVTEFAPRAVE